MKQITIAIHDNSQGNYNLELIKFIKDNVKVYPKITDEIEFIYFDELNKLTPDFLPDYINRYVDLKSYNQVIQKESSRYLMFVDAQDALIQPLKQLLKVIKKQSADVIVTPLMQQDYFGETKLIKTDNQIRLFEKEKFNNYYADVAMHQVKATLFKKAFLNNHDLLNYHENHLTSFLFYAKVILNVPVTNIVVQPFYAVRISNQSNEEIEKKLNQLLNEYEQVLRYQQIDMNHPYNKYVRCAYLNKLDQLFASGKINGDFKVDEYLKNFSNLDNKHANEVKKYEYKRYKQKRYNVFFKSKTLNKLFINVSKQEKQKQKLNNLVYKLFSILPIKTNKVLIINSGNNYQGEMRYLVNQMLKEGDKQIYCTSLTKVKGVNTFNQQKKLVNLYHLVTAKQIINLDTNVKQNKVKANQELIQMYNDKNHQRILIDQNNYLTYYPKQKQKQVQENLKNVATIWVENNENRRYLRQSLGNKKIIVKDFASTTWLKKYQDSGKMLTLLRKKYHFEMLKEYVLYIADETPYYQFIDVEKINQRLTKNQILVIVPPKNKYEIVNIKQQAYMLLDHQVNLVELCLAADAIIDNNHYYVTTFKSLNKQIIDINYCDEIRNEIIGEF